jgi:anti-sigma-K factor RskA
MIDLLAAEYVLGTLRGPAAQRFERLLRSDAGVAQRVREWETRLSGLAHGVDPVTPPVGLWQGIEARLPGAAPAATSGGRSLFDLRGWRRLAIAFGLVAAVALTGLLQLFLAGDRPTCYAVLTNDRKLPVLVVFDRRNMQELAVLPVGSALASRDGAARLWIAVGARLTAVGTLNPDGETTLRLDKPMLTAVMADGARLLVTVEPVAAAGAAIPAGPTVAEGTIALLGASQAPARGI